jgi:Protein of unknown function (DUF1353)
MMKLIAFTMLAVAVWSEASAQAPPPAFSVKQFNDGTQWIVTESFVYRIGNSKLSVAIPKGFVTDYASIPPGPLRALFIPTGQYGRASVVHDFLYWTQWCSREQADRIFLFAMIESKVPADTRIKMYAAVRAGGDPSWRANQQERKIGLPRILPEGFLDIDPLDVWSSYRQKLYVWGVRPEPPTIPSPAYCAADEGDLR